MTTPDTAPSADQDRTPATAAPPFDVCCPKCGALQGQRCKTLATGRTTDTHHDRHAASWKWRAFNAATRT